MIPIYTYIYQARKKVKIKYLKELRNCQDNLVKEKMCVGRGRCIEHLRKKMQTLQEYDE